MLEGKVAVITGAASGIGQGIAFGLAEKKASIVAADINAQGAEEVAGELRSKNHEAIAVKVDVSVPAEVDNLISAALDKFGRIDILVNDAGIDPGPIPTTEISEEQWDRVINVNLKGVFLCGRAAARVMIKQGGGKIINIASTGAHGAMPEKAVYCSSKGGVLALTRVMAMEWAKDNITVNSISPGRTETAIVRAMKKLQPPEVFEKRTRRIPLGRIAQVEDIANLATFLAGKESDYITGQDIIIDGGLFAIHPGFVQ
jgi:NAD(P)-dependent dehydrogenase (short-subunit alcohol dehydrogenase family)